MRAYLGLFEFRFMPFSRAAIGPGIVVLTIPPGRSSCAFLYGSRVSLRCFVTASMSRSLDRACKYLRG